MTAHLLAALDIAGTTVDEGGHVCSAIEAAVANPWVARSRPS